MADISVRVGQTNAIKVLSSSTRSLENIPRNVVGGIASVSSLYVSGLSTFVGVSTFHEQVYNDKSFHGLSFEGISGITTVGSISGITTVKNDLYVGGNLNISSDVNVSTVVGANSKFTGISTSSKFTTGSWLGGVEQYDGITLSSGTSDETGSATISGPNILYLDPKDIAGEIGLVHIKGNLRVIGTTFTQSNQIISIGDFRIGIASAIASDANLNGAGIGIGSTSIQKTFLFDDSTDTLQSSIGLGISDGAAFKAGSNLLLNKTTLGPTVVGSSLTTVGTLTELVVSGILTAGAIDGGSF